MTWKIWSEDQRREGEFSSACQIKSRQLQLNWTGFERSADYCQSSMTWFFRYKDA